MKHFQCMECGKSGHIKCTKEAKSNKIKIDSKVINDLNEFILQKFREDDLESGSEGEEGERKYSMNPEQID